MSLVEGKVKVYRDGRDGKPGGYGFLIPDFGGPDVFFSIRHWKAKGTIPQAGDRVSYTEEPDAHRGNGAMMAINVEKI
jgi:cold shock CspA family protein